MNTSFQLRLIQILFVLLVGLSAASSASPILNIDFSETIAENVRYDPLGSTSGLYADAGENQSNYSASGSINISNIHATQAAQDVLINISGISTISNVVNNSGSGFVSEFNTASDYMLLFIPDIGAGSFVEFTYDVNTSLVAPALNLTASYSDSRVFAGQPITITDTVQNVMNATAYPNNCVYNISLVHNALSINNSGSFLNVTFDDSSLSGSDSSNASVSGDNLSITWNALAGGCLNAATTTDISYDAITPTGINSANTYEIVNTTMTYQYNGTFSRIGLVSTEALVDLDLEFEKFLNNTLTGDNATWQITSEVSNPTDIDVNLTQVSLWVSVRDGTGTGFTNPSIIDNDTISGTTLTNDYFPNVLLNSSTVPWNNSGSEWNFNYTFSSSPIVWMDFDALVIDDGLQIQNRSVSYGQDVVYIKELYLATGYWLEISRNITRLSDNNFNVLITVTNLGSSPTPADQAVQVYNFIPNTFTLTSPFVYSISPWYTTDETNATLVDPIYNGTMYQFALLANGNPSNSSLDLYGGASNVNNTWTLTYNVSGSGEFNFDDLFLTGVDPLAVGQVGGTQAVVVEGAYSFASAKVEYILGVLALVIGALVLFM
ncbi:MAG: hypothetical protein VXZ40_01000 [Nanoarchaeota archaeon]|nr:hypothetical protein [Nanoarchaeota archaeon]